MRATTWYELTEDIDNFVDYTLDDLGDHNFYDYDETKKKVLDILRVGSYVSVYTYDLLMIAASNIGLANRYDREGLYLEYPGAVDIIRCNIFEDLEEIILERFDQLFARWLRNTYAGRCPVGLDDIELIELYFDEGFEEVT